MRDLENAASPELVHAAKQALRTLDDNARAAAPDLDLMFDEDFAHNERETPLN